LFKEEVKIEKIDKPWVPTDLDLLIWEVRLFFNNIHHSIPLMDEGREEPLKDCYILIVKVTTADKFFSEMIAFLRRKFPLLEWFDLSNLGYPGQTGLILPKNSVSFGYEIGNDGTEKIS
jgi:hypothetical protein